VKEFSGLRCLPSNKKLTTTTDKKKQKNYAFRQIYFHRQSSVTSLRQYNCCLTATKAIAAFMNGMPHFCSLPKNNHHEAFDDRFAPLQYRLWRFGTKQKIS